MNQFEDPTDYTFQTPDGKEITFSAYDLDSALCNAPPNSELIRVNDDPRFQGVFSYPKIPAVIQLDQWHTLLPFVHKIVYIKRVNQRSTYAF